MTSLFTSTLWTIIKYQHGLHAGLQNPSKWVQIQSCNHVYLQTNTQIGNPGLQSTYCLSYSPTHPLVQDMTQGQSFKRSLTSLNSENSFSSTSCPIKA